MPLIEAKDTRSDKPVNPPLILCVCVCVVGIKFTQSTKSFIYTLGTLCGHCTLAHTRARISASAIVIKYRCYEFAFVVSASAPDALTMCRLQFFFSVCVCVCVLPLIPVHIYRAMRARALFLCLCTPLGPLRLRCALRAYDHSCIVRVSNFYRYNS